VEAVGVLEERRLEIMAGKVLRFKGYSLTLVPGRCLGKPSRRLGLPEDDRV
jgi:hypothetical protein